MLRSEWSESRVKSIFARGRIWALWFIAASLAVVFALSSAAQAQEFTLDASPFSPDAISPSGTASSHIQIGSTTGFTGIVNLSCQVSPSDSSITDPPICLVSPASVNVPATATATVTTKADTTTIQYNITITGTSANSTVTTAAIPLTVLSVTPQFTISVTSTVAPSSVVAGSGAQGVVTVNPINGYVNPQGEGVTLACATISPLVTIAPVCSFTYPKGGNSLQVTGPPESATLTINTFGPITTGAHSSRKAFGLWITAPLLGLVGIGAASGKRVRRAWAVLALFVLCASFILTPACGNSTNSTTTPNGITPANTYTFTIIGVDSNGVVSSNTSSTSSGPTVSLTVTAPPKTP